MKQIKTLLIAAIFFGATQTINAQTKQLTLMLKSWPNASNVRCSKTTRKIKRDL
jgi:hypothetical protein